MITGKQLKIFEAIAKSPFAEFTRKQVKELSKEKSNNALALVIDKLKKEGVLSERKIGKSGLLTLNLDNDLSYYYLALANDQRTDKQAETAVKMLKDEITNATLFYSIAIFGSHAENRQNESSDIDIAVFIDEKEKKRQIEAIANSAKLKILAETDIHVITKAEFIEMLTNSEENLGKQIARKHIALHNHQIFYGLIREGMKHGVHV